MLYIGARYWILIALSINVRFIRFAPAHFMLKTVFHSTLGLGLDVHGPKS